MSQNRYQHGFSHSFNTHHPSSDKSIYSYKNSGGFGDLTENIFEAIKSPHSKKINLPSNVVSNNFGRSNTPQVWDNKQKLNTKQFLRKSTGHQTQTNNDFLDYYRRRINKTNSERHRKDISINGALQDHYYRHQKQSPVQQILKQKGLKETKQTKKYVFDGYKNKEDLLTLFQEKNHKNASKKNSQQTPKKPNSIQFIKNNYLQSFSKQTITSETLNSEKETKREKQYFRMKNYQEKGLTPKLQTLQNPEKIKRIYSPICEPTQFYTFESFKEKPQFKANIKDFIFGKKIGGGKFGTVFQAIHIKSNSIYALKKIPKDILIKNKMVVQFTLEVKIQSFLHNEHIVQVYGMFDDTNHIYLILEYLPDGSLLNLLKKNKRLAQQDVRYKIKQIATAIQCMHKNGVVHRDIKPENIVISGQICKLCDFGWATCCQDDERRKTFCGTFDYTAPEILERSSYDKSVDIWCLGILAYQLLVGTPPFYHTSRKETLTNILSVDLNYPKYVSYRARNFIDAILRKNAQQRLSYEQVLKHPFLVVQK